MPRPSSGLVVERRETHHALVTAVALSRDGVWAASAGADGSLVVWDAGSGSCAHLDPAGTGRCFVTGFLVATAVSFGVIFVAELGDKSQLMALTFATRYRAPAAAAAAAATPPAPMP